MSWAFKSAAWTSSAEQKHRSKGRSREQADKRLYAGSVLGAPGFEGDEYVP